MTADRGRSDASGSAEADRDLAAALDDDRHQPASARVLEHSIELCYVFLDVDECERDVPPLVIVTGGLGVGSTVLPEDLNHRSPRSSAHESAQFNTRPEIRLSGPAT